MAKKDENLKRLHELADILGREPDISGSAADIAQRVAEWEEEADVFTETASEITAVAKNASAEDGSKPDRVLIRALQTLHITALSPDEERYTELVLQGMQARIPRNGLAALVKAGLVEACGE